MNTALANGQVEMVEAAGAVPALVALYREHCRFVWASLYRLGVHETDLEDMLQEVFVLVHRRLSEFDGQRGGIRTWLFNLSRGVASNYRRRRHIQRATVEECTDAEALSSAPDPEEAAARAEAHARLESILAEMSLDKRITFLMYEVDRLSTEEIASILGIERGTVHSRLHAARREFERSVRRYRLLDNVKETP